MILALLLLAIPLPPRSAKYVMGDGRSSSPATT